MGVVPRNASATRSRILDVAERLVIDQGYGATSLDQVITESGSSKGAFFHHFASKQAMADALVERYVAADLAWLAEGLDAAHAASDDPAERAVAFVRFYEERGDEITSESSGCLYAAVLAERQLIGAGTTDPVGRAIAQWRVGFAGLLEAALPAGHDVDVDALSDHFFATFEGAFLLARSTGDPSHMRRQLGVLRQMVEVLVRR